MKSKKASTIILGLVFLVGLSVLLYPTISDYVNQFSASHAIAGYDKALSNMSEADYALLLDTTKTYNRDLASGNQHFVNGAPENEAYRELLNITGNSMMGYVEIKKLHVTLPIFHGTSEETLQTGVGHLEGSSIPVGGESTHAVLTGHRGLPSAKLFTDLDRMEKGDLFTITVLNEVLTYEVDQISIVEPTDISQLKIIPGEDHVTLVTCTPYAVNTHRLLVRGVRVDGPASDVHVAADAALIDPMLVAPALAAPILIILLIVLLTRTKKSGAKKNKK